MPLHVKKKVGDAIAGNPKHPAARLQVRNAFSEAK